MTSLDLTVIDAMDAAALAAVTYSNFVEVVAALTAVKEAAELQDDCGPHRAAFLDGI